MMECMKSMAKKPQTNADRIRSMTDEDLAEVLFGSCIEHMGVEECFYYRMSYFSIVQELFLFRTSHSGGTSTRAKCKQLGVDWSDGIEFSFGGDEE